MQTNSQRKHFFKPKYFAHHSSSHTVPWLLHTTFSHNHFNKQLQCIEKKEKRKGKIVMSTLGDDELSLILNLDQRLKWQKLTLSCLHAMAKSWGSVGSLNQILSKIFYANSQIYAHLIQRSFSAMLISKLCRNMSQNSDF